MLYIIEYNENMNPNTGLFTYILTEKELENDFEIVGDYDMSNS